MAIYDDAIQKYLMRYQYGNAKTFQLWQSIEDQVPDIHVESVMDTWTKQSGFPIVQVSYSESTGAINVTQQHCMSMDDDGTSWPKSPYGYGSSGYPDMESLLHWLLFIASIVHYLTAICGISHCNM